MSVALAFFVFYEEAQTNSRERKQTPRIANKFPGTQTNSAHRKQTRRNANKVRASQTTPKHQK